MPGPLVTIRDLHLSFRGPPLLDGVSCHIEVGQRIGLLGRNGTGKTSLLRMLAGATQPDAGEVTLAPAATCTSWRDASMPSPPTSTTTDPGITRTGRPKSAAGISCTATRITAPAGGADFLGEVDEFLQHLNSADCVRMVSGDSGFQALRETLGLDDVRFAT
jgi:energy-coupling factor transporter ATP-binding protein EcfA2